MQPVKRTVGQSALRQCCRHGLAGAVVECFIRPTRPFSVSTARARIDPMHHPRPVEKPNESYYLPRRIHILGTGSIGKLVAHSIRSLTDPPPVTLLVRRDIQMMEWEHGRKELSIITGSQINRQTGFDVDFARPYVAPRNYVAPYGQRSWVVPADKAIHTLIVAVPADATVTALTMVKNRLAKGATVLFLQNGMGVMERIQQSLYGVVKKAWRPHFLTGVTTHGVTSVNNWTAIHAGEGSIQLGLPYEFAESSSMSPTYMSLPVSTRYLLRTLIRCPGLAAMTGSPSDLYLARLEKLAVNCVINPLTVMMDMPNGGILNNYHLTRVMRLLLAEISTVIRAMPELKHLPDVGLRFSAERLETMVVLVAKRTARNLSSMLQSVRKGSPTEIEYLNGYIVQRGEELGFKCVMNYMMVQMVRGKSAMIKKEHDGKLPYTTLPLDDI